MEIRPLVVSTDPSMATQSGQFSGGPRIRAIEYSKHIEKMVYLVLTMNSHRAERILIDNLVIFPTNSTNRIEQFFAAYREGCRLIEKYDLNIIDAQEPWYSGVVAYLLSRKYSLPLCVGLYGDDLDNPVWLSDSLRNRVFNLIGKYIIKRSDSLHVSGIAIRDRMKNIGIDDRRIHVLPIFVELSRFQNVAADRAMFGLPSDAPVVLSVGRLDRLKNLRMLLNAAKLVVSSHQVVFAIVGTGPEKESLEKLAIDLGIESKVMFLGAMEYSKMPQILKCADIFVLTSNLEGRSMAAVEAMLSGLPLLMTDISGGRDIVSEGQNGYLVEMNDHGELAKRIIELLSDEEKRKLMGKNSMNFALHTQTLVENASKMARYYQDTITFRKDYGAPST